MGNSEVVSVSHETYCGYSSSSLLAVSSSMCGYSNSGPHIMIEKSREREKERKWSLELSQKIASHISVCPNGSTRWPITSKVGRITFKPIVCTSGDEYHHFLLKPKSLIGE